MANTNTSTARNQHQEKSSSSTTTATTSTTTTTSATTIITTYVTTTVGNTTSTIIITNTTATNSSSATEAEAIDDGPSDVPTCFYSPPDMSCQDLHKGDDDLTYSTTCEYNTTTSDSDHTMLGYNLTLESLLAEGSFVGRSIAAMKTMYTPEIAADTTSFAERDLLMLGYPYWDGNDVMQHVRDLEHMAITANCTDLSLYY